MHYYRNSELAKQHAVSMRAVSNWIKAAQQGKLDLGLYEANKKTYIANTGKNAALIEELVQRGKKYRNTRGSKVVRPKPEFYQLFNSAQAFDIISSLDIRREIPHKYSYADGGAEAWNEYALKMWAENLPNNLNRTVALLQSNIDNIDRLLGRRKRVNVVDIGPGNGLPVKDLIAHLMYERGVLVRYVAIDISAEMLAIAKRNIEEWFDGRVAFEGHVRDITRDRFDDLLLPETLRKDADDTVNMALFLGGTVTNLPSPDEALRVVYNSLGRRDILVYADKPDTAAARRFFDFDVGEDIQPLSTQEKIIPDLLNIDPTLYDVEMGFDEAKKQRYIRIRLKVALTIVFEFKEGARHLELQRGDTILLWRAWHQTTRDMINRFERNGFVLLQASMTEDREYMLMAVGIDTPSA